MENNKENNNLYNSMIIALIIGIIVVILSLIFLRSEPEYFSELYYTNHKSLPFSIIPERENYVNITISNYEKNDTTYKIKTTIEYDNQTLVYDEREELIKKDTTLNLTIPYKVPQFKKAKIKTEIFLENKTQDIHFFVYNENIILKYPEYIALINCIPKYNLTGFLEINASGNQSNLKIRINGIEEFFTIVEENKIIETGIEIKQNDFIDIVFDNDYGNSTFDRNIYIYEIKIGDNKIKKPYLADLGKEKESVDCENLRNITKSLPWNAAIRLRTW